MKTIYIIAALIITTGLAVGCKLQSERPDTRGVRSVEIISFYKGHKDTTLHITNAAEINAFADLFVTRGSNPTSDNIKREIPKVDGRIIFLKGKMIAGEANYCFGHGYQFTTGEDTSIHLFTKRLESVLVQLEYSHRKFNYGNTDSIVGK